MPSQFQIPVRLVVTVATAGTPVQASATPVVVRAFTMQAHYLNTGVMLMGDSAANAASANAHALAAGDNMGLAGSNIAMRDVQIDLSDFWINSTVNGEKVIITYLQELLNQ